MKQADISLNLSTKRGRPPFSEETILRIHFIQHWLTLSNPAMEEATLIMSVCLLLLICEPRN